jgi:sugar phosphate isomerase/epimerase
MKCCFRALKFLEDFGKEVCSSHWHSNHFDFDKIVYPEQVEIWLKSIKERIKGE